VTVIAELVEFRPAGATGNTMGSMPLGVQLVAASYVISAATPLSMVQRTSLLHGFSSSYGLSIPPPRCVAIETGASWPDRTSAFASQLAPIFSGRLKEIATCATPYDSLRAEGLLDRDVNYPDLVQLGLLTFEDTTAALAAIESDAVATFTMLRHKNYTRKAMAKRSFLYKLCQLSMIAFVAGLVSQSAVAIMITGGLMLLGAGTVESRVLFRAYQDVKADFLMNGRILRSPIGLYLDLRYIRDVRRKLARARGTKQRNAG
jgi:hypothetical protein